MNSVFFRFPGEFENALTVRYEIRNDGVFMANAYAHTSMLTLEKKHLEKSGSLFAH